VSIISGVGLPNLPVEGEDRDPVDGIDLVRRLLHVVLELAAHPVLRSKGRGEPDLLDPRERVEAVREIRGQRDRVAEERHALAAELLQEGRGCQQGVDAESDHEGALIMGDGPRATGPQGLRSLSEIVSPEPHDACRLP